MGFFDKIKTFMGGGEKHELELLDCANAFATSGTSLSYKIIFTAKSDCTILGVSNDLSLRYLDKDGIESVSWFFDHKDKDVSVFPISMKNGEKWEYKGKVPVGQDENKEMEAFFRKHKKPELQLSVEVLLKEVGSLFAPDVKQNISLIHVEGLADISQSEKDISISFSNLFKEEKYDEAYNVLVKGIELYPQNPSFHSNKGALAFMIYDFPSNCLTSIEDYLEGMKLGFDKNVSEDNIWEAAEEFYKQLKQEDGSYKAVKLQSDDSICRATHFVNVYLELFPEGKYVQDAHSYLAEYQNWNEAQEPEEEEEENVKPQFTDEEVEKDYEAKTKGLEAVLGEMYGMVGHAIIPFEVGGAVDMYYFTNHIKGTGFATMELLDPAGNGPKPNRLGTYELVAFTKEAYNEMPEDLEARTAFNLIERRICGIFTILGNYSFQAVLNPNETCEIPSKEGDNKCLVLDLYQPENTEFKIGDRKHHLLLCIEIFRSEMEFARANGTASLLDKLKNAGHYPYSDLDRNPVA